MKINKIDKQFIVEAAREIVKTKGLQVVVGIQSKWKEELEFDMFDLGDIFLSVFIHTGLIPDLHKLRTLYEAENMTLGELAEFINANLISSKSAR